MSELKMEKTWEESTKEAEEFIEEIMNAPAMIKKRQMLRIKRLIDKENEEQKIVNSFKVREKDKFLELILDGTIALYETRWSKDETYYFCISAENGKRGETVYDTKLGAIVGFIAENNDCKEHTRSVLKLLNLG